MILETLTETMLPFFFPKLSTSQLNNTEAAILKQNCVSYMTNIHRAQIYPACGMWEYGYLSIQNIANKQ